LIRLKEDWKGFVLAYAGYDLRALGRLVEAAQPMQVALDGEVAQERWKRAAQVANNLSELYLTIGDVMHALANAEQSVGFADKSEDEFIQMVNRTKVGDSQHQAGNLAKAQTAFNEAEEIQKKRQPEYPLLYSLPGYLYCNLLLSQGNYTEVERRASQTLEWAKQQQYGGPLLDTALNNLSLGRAHLLNAQQTSEVSKTPEVLRYLNRAADGLRQAGVQEMIVHGLLARAAYYRVTGDLNKTQKDLIINNIINEIEGAIKERDKEAFVRLLQQFLTMKLTAKRRRYTHAVSGL